MIKVMMDLPFEVNELYDRSRDIHDSRRQRRRTHGHPAGAKKGIGVSTVGATTSCGRTCLFKKGVREFFGAPACIESNPFSASRQHQML